LKAHTLYIGNKIEFLWKRKETTNHIAWVPFASFFCRLVQMLWISRVFFPSSFPFVIYWSLAMKWTKREMIDLKKVSNRCPCNVDSVPS
jgi:hypothetical protein